MKQKTILYLTAGTMLVCALMAFLTAIPQAASAAALDAARSTVSLDGDGFPATLGSSTVYYGALVAAGADGLVVPAANTAGLRVVGVAGSQSDGVLHVRRGVFRFGNSGLSVTNVGDCAWVVDDQTVGPAASNRWVAAGTLLQVDSAGAWIDVGRIGGGALASAIAGGIHTGIAAASNGLVQGQLYLSSGALKVMP